MPIPEELTRVFQRQKYQIVGRHSAVKTCHWTKRALSTGEKEYCYKQKFYGIRSLRCLQMTPSLGRCLQACLFCWRATSSDLGIDWNEAEFLPEEAESPSCIAEGSLKAQRKALIGFKGNRKVDRTLLDLALKPTHVAVSLEGEVTLYPWIGELIDEYFELGLETVLVVTNGLRPDVLSKMKKEPSQLYVSVSAPDENTYKSACRPLVSNGWKRINETLEFLNSVSCPTVIRMTLAKGVNMKDHKGYAKLIEKANPTYLEPKAAMAVGFFTNRLPWNAMPFHSEIREFAENLAGLTSYRIIDEAEASGVVLLSRLEKAKKLAG